MLRRLITTLALLSPSALMAQSDKDASIITGVVDGLGGGGGFQKRDETGWTSSFQLVAWRESGPQCEGPLRTDTLRVEIPYQRQTELPKWARIFPARTLVRFVIREPVRDVNGRPFAELRAPLPRVADAELLAAAEPILNPSPVIDSLFGTFTPDRQFPQSFRQKHEWLGREVDLVLDLEFVGPPGRSASQQALAHLHDVWSKREEWDARIREAIAEDSYEAWRDTWREDDQPVIDREAFKARFELESMSFATDGSFDAFYADDDLFGGHAIVVDYFPEEGTLHVSIYG